MAKPMVKPPMRGMPMPMHKGGTKPPPPPMPHAPVPQGGVGPGAGAMGAMPSVQAPQGYAFGTRDVPAPPVPAPGQTITNGSWTGPTPQAPAPVPLGGQNQNLRKNLGMGVPRFAAGTMDVSGPNASGGGSDFPKTQPAEQGPTPGYDAQTGMYSALDEHFVAHLRAAMGLPPKMQGFAGGTPNVGQPPFNPQANVGAAAAPAPAPMQDQAPDPNDFTARAAAQQVYTGADAMPQGQPGGSVPGPITNYGRAAQQDPIMGSVLQTLLSVPKSFAVHDDGTVKQIPDPNQTEHLAKTTGATTEQANAMLNAHHYTEDEFVNAVRGMPIALAEKLWNMQHYLNPQQQTAEDYNKQLQAGVDTAGADLQNAQGSGKTPPGKLKEYEASLKAQLDEQARHRKVVTEGQGAYYQ